MYEIRLDVYSHHLRASGYSRQGKEVLVGFARTMAEYGLKRVAPQKFVRAMLRVFAAATRSRDEFRFHINQYDQLLRHIGNAGMDTSRVEVVRHGLYIPAPAPMEIISGKELVDYQKEITHYLASDGHIKVVPLQTGKGKTLIALSAVARMSVRTVVVIKGMYVEKWKSDIKEELGLGPPDVMVVRGSKDLRSLIMLAQADELKAKIIIITNKTLYMFMQTYEQFDGDSSNYGCSPVELFPLLKAGVRLIDEVHQDFHFNFRLDLYSHVPKTINLSATLESDNSFMNDMYRVAFPPECRPPDFGYDKYVAAVALFYSLEYPRQVRWKQRGRGTYSHVKFEESIMKNQRMLNNYLKLIAYIISVSYIRVREPGQKALIFCSKVEMCEEVATYLRQQHPDLRVQKYTQQDDDEVLENSDIIVSTLKSCGTARDIDGLRMVLLTDALGSQQANEQAKGRLRKLKGEWADVTPQFLYLVCRDIDKHIRYHEKKKEFFSGRVISHKEMELPMKV